MRFYGVDLRDLWRRDDRGRRVLTLRRLHVLIKHLPTDSATHFYLFGPIARWGPTEHLLADLWELWANRGRRKGSKERKYPRPTKQDRPIPQSERLARAQRKREKLLRQRHRYQQPE